MTVASALRRRRAVRDHDDALRANAALRAAAADLRRQAQAHLLAGRPDLAAPYLDEVALFEGAVQEVPGL